MPKCRSLLALLLAGPIPGETPRLSTTITTFAPDERLGLTVPREMRTTWPYTGRDATGRPVNGTATYEQFRRFDVTTEATIAPPVQP